MSVIEQPACDLAFLEGKLSAELAAKLLDPERDPARALPDYALADEGPGDVDPNLPSVDDIEAALNTHVVEGISPLPLIERLLHPFGKAVHIELTPGKGRKRLNYAIIIPSFNIMMTRASTRATAEGLHRLGARLSRHAVGDRAPQSAPLLKIEVGEYNAYPSSFTIRAVSVAAARRAYAAIAGRPPANVHVEMDYKPKDILPHIIAARDIIADEVLGQPALRAKAIELIAATQDLRTVATVLLRQNPKIRSHHAHRIEIDLADNITVEVFNKNLPQDSAHEKMIFLNQCQGLIDALHLAVARHPVLKSLGSNFRIQMQGDPTYLSLTITDMSLPPDHVNHRIPSSMFEYACLAELIERLAACNNPVRNKKAQWKLHVRGSRRGRGSWTFYGETLAHGIAQAVQEDTSRTSMALFDLAIDLIAQDSGEETSIEMYRILVSP